MGADHLRSVVEAAERAPSVHNTQPWRFATHRTSTGAIDGLDVLADVTRAVGVIDPFGRELHISCGAAIEFARVAARNLGLAGRVHVLPDPENPDVLAFVEFGAGEPATVEEAELSRALASRYTERERFDDRSVPSHAIDLLRGAAESVGAWIRVLDQPGDRIQAAVLMSHADALETDDPEYHEELASWARTEADAGDGIPTSALPSTPVAARGSSFPLRDFDASEHTRQAPDGDDPPPAERPLVMVVGTEGDDRYAWLSAGQALGRLLLRAAAEGLSVSPMTQVLEVPATRSMLTQQLGLLGHPQMLLRVGYRTGPRPTLTPRRPVAEVLTI